MLRSETQGAGPDWTEPADLCGAEVLDRPTGSLTDTERTHLAELVERIQLAHDLAITFADRYATFPTRFCATQAREMTLLRTLLDRYHLPTAPATTRPGRFADPATQRDFDDLTERGRTGRAAALYALTDALLRVRGLLDSPPDQWRAPDVHDAYRQTLVATNHQFAVVHGWCTR